MSFSLFCLSLLLQLNKFPMWHKLKNTSVPKVLGVVKAAELHVLALTLLVLIHTQVLYPKLKRTVQNLL